MPAKKPRDKENLTIVFNLILSFITACSGKAIKLVKGLFDNIP